MKIKSWKPQMVVRRQQRKEGAQEESGKIEKQGRSAEREGKSGMWLDGILGKVCSSLSHSLDLSWGQIPHGAERKPAGVCRATSTQECFTSNGKCSQLLVRLSLSLYFSISIYPSLSLSVTVSETCCYVQLNSSCACDNQYFQFCCGSVCPFSEFCI